MSETDKTLTEKGWLNMKIWCLKCGSLITHTDSCEKRETLCPCCSERIAYSVSGNEAYIACLNYDLSVNNELRVVGSFQNAG